MSRIVLLFLTALLMKGAFASENTPILTCDEIREHQHLISYPLKFEFSGSDELIKKGCERYTVLSIDAFDDFKRNRAPYWEWALGKIIGEDIVYAAIYLCTIEYSTLVNPLLNLGNLYGLKIYPNDNFLDHNSLIQNFQEKFPNIKNIVFKGGYILNKESENRSSLFSLIQSLKEAGITCQACDKDDDYYVKL